MSRQNRKKPMAEINVVPYIDVMLVLLVIFMVTAPILAQGIKVDLPKAVAKPLETEQNQESLIVSITADGTYVLERGEDAETASELGFIQEYTGKVLRQQPATPVYIRGDRSIEYGVVVELMAALQIAGAESVGLITEVP